MHFGHVDLKIYYSFKKLSDEAVKNLSLTVDNDPNMQRLTSPTSCKKADISIVGSGFSHSQPISAKDSLDNDEETFSFGSFSSSKVDVVHPSGEVHHVDTPVNENNRTINESQTFMNCYDVDRDKHSDLDLSTEKKSSHSGADTLKTATKSPCPSVDSGSDVLSNIKIPQSNGKKKSFHVGTSNIDESKGALDRNFPEDKRNVNQITPSCAAGFPTSIQKNAGTQNLNSSSSSSTSGGIGTPKGSKINGQILSGSHISGNFNNWVRRKTLFHEKGSILASFTRGQSAPPEMKELYGSFCKEREPANKLPELDDKIKFVPRVVVVEDTSSPEYKYKQALVTFNKLSLQNFDRILEKFLALGIETEESLYARIIELIVSKAQLEPTFCDMYVRFCKCVQERISQVDKELGDNFREKLLERCKEEFEMDRDAAFAQIEGEDLNAEEMEEKKYVLKLRYIGHMKFIGELYQHDVVNAKIMHTCIQDLLDSTEEEKLVCVCKLLQVIGKKLEEYDIKKRKKEKLELWKTYFKSMEAKSVDATRYSSRVRFMFKDVIELHANKWLNRNEMEANKMTPNNKSQERSMNTSQHGSRSRDELAGQSQDGWSTVGSSKGKKANVVSNASSFHGGHQSVAPVKSSVSTKLNSASSVHAGRDFRKDGAGIRGLGQSNSVSATITRHSVENGGRKTQDISLISGKFLHCSYFLLFLTQLSHATKETK